MVCSYPHAYHTQSHHHNADDEESAGLHHTEEGSTGETSDGTEDEIERCGESSIIKTPSQALHQNLRSCGIGTHINALDMDRAYGDERNPIVSKSEFVLSLYEQLIGDGMVTAKEKSILGRCTEQC